MHKGHAADTGANSQIRFSNYSHIVAADRVSRGYFSVFGKRDLIHIVDAQCHQTLDIIQLD